MKEDTGYRKCPEAREDTIKCLECRHNKVHEEGPFCGIIEPTCCPACIPAKPEEVVMARLTGKI